MQIRIPQERADQAGHLVRLIIREPFQKRTWAELAFFLTSSALCLVGVFAFAALGTLGLLLTVVVVGVFILAGGLRLARGLGGWQRLLAQQIIGEAIPEPEPFNPRPGLFAWLRASLGDRSAWRSAGYLVAKIPLTLFGVWFALSIWIEAIFGILSPLDGDSPSARIGPFGRIVGPPFGGGGGYAPTARLGIFVVGLLLLLLAPWTMRVVVYLDRRMMHLLLGPDAATSRVRILEIAIEDARCRHGDPPANRAQSARRYPGTARSTCHAAGSGEGQARKHRRRC